MTLPDTYGRAMAAWQAARDKVTISALCYAAELAKGDPLGTAKVHHDNLLARAAEADRLADALDAEQAAFRAAQEARHG